jgi:hypothetical protein
MGRNRNLAAVGAVLAGLLLVGCDGPPTKATYPIIADAKASPEKLAGRGTGAVSTKGGDFSGNLNEARVENTTDTDAFFTLVVWDYADGVNQVMVGASDPIWVERHTVVTLYTNAFEQDPCKRYQRDIYMNLKKADRYTMSDVPYPFAASEKLVGPTQHCRNDNPPPPPPPTCEQRGDCPPPPPPSCRVDAPYYFEAGTILAQNAPWYPTHTDFIAFTPPKDFPVILHVTTGDQHNKADEPPPYVQTGEVVAVEFYENGTLLGTLGPTPDVPDTYSAFDVITWDFPVVFDHQIDHIRVVHAGVPPNDEPTNSVTLVSVGVTCAEGNVGPQRKR